MSFATAQDFIQKGLTYRRLDHWTSQGWLQAETDHPGWGRNRRWPVSELRIAEVMIHLTDKDISPEMAARMARNPNEGAEVLRQLADVVAGVTS